MSRDVLTVGSTMRIPLLYRGEYSQCVERFMNYLDEQTDGEAMTNSIKNDKSMWSDQEKRIQKIDRLARSLLIQGLPNDIYSLIDSNKTAKDLWDALTRHMLVLDMYATTMRQNKNLMDINIDALYNILKQNQGDVNDAMGSKKKTVVVTSDPLALIAKKQNELKKIINRIKFYSKPTNNNLRTLSTSQSAIKKQEFVKSDDKQVMKKADEEKKQIGDQEVLYDKMSVQLVEMDKHVRDLKNTVLEKEFKISELEECVRNKYLEIEKCLERLNVCENKLYKMGQTNQTVHMIMPSKDNLYNGRKGIGFENPSYFEKAKDLRPTLYDEKVIGLGNTPMFRTHSDEALEIEKFKRSRENKIEFEYDYGNLNASYVNEKINFE
nr:hypothetical protein [Tanacetum cinerariifolium]